MLLSAVSVLVVAQPSSEVPEGLMNYSVYICSTLFSLEVEQFEHATYLQVLNEVPVWKLVV